MTDIPKIVDDQEYHVTVKAVGDSKGGLYVAYLDTYIECNEFDNDCVIEIKLAPPVFPTTAGSVIVDAYNDCLVLNYDDKWMTLYGRWVEEEDISLPFTVKYDAGKE